MIDRAAAVSLAGAAGDGAVWVADMGGNIHSANAKATPSKHFSFRPQGQKIVIAPSKELRRSGYWVEGFVQLQRRSITVAEKRKRFAHPATVIDRCYRLRASGGEFTPEMQICLISIARLVSMRGPMRLAQVSEPEQVPVRLPGRARRQARRSSAKPDLMLNSWPRPQPRPSLFRPSIRR